MIKRIAYTVIALGLAGQLQSASAQMGTSNNPPPQRLFDTGPSQRVDNGLGTMAERRAKLAQMKRTQRPVQR